MGEEHLAVAERIHPSRHGGSPPVARRRRRRWPDAGWAFLLIGPVSIGLAVFTIWPAFQTFYFSFTKWGDFGGHTWTGIANYVAVVQDPEFGQSLLNTLVLTALSLIGIPLSIIIAALLNRRGLRGLTIYRTLYYIPVVTLPAAVALVWGMLYNGDYGIFNWILSLVGIHGPSWMSDPATAIYAVAVVVIWGSIGYNMVLFLAGLQSIPRDYYEAAEMDGASRLRQFIAITVPLLSPTTFFVTVITMINCLQIFDLVYLMVGATSPARETTQTVVKLFYEKGFVEGKGGYASATAFILLAIIVIVTVLQFRLQRRWVHYE